MCKCPNIYCHNKMLASLFDQFHSDPFWGMLGVKMEVKKVKKLLMALHMMFRKCKFPHVSYFTEAIRYSHPCLTNFIF